MLFQRAHNVGSSHNDYWMSVLNEFTGGLIGQTGGGDEHAELAVANPRDQSRGFTDAGAVSWRRSLALRLESELNVDGASPDPNAIQSQGVTSSVPPRSREIDGVCV